MNSQLVNICQALSYCLQVSLCATAHEYIVLCVPAVILLSKGKE